MQAKPPPAPDLPKLPGASANPASGNKMPDRAPVLGEPKVNFRPVSCGRIGPSNKGRSIKVRVLRERTHPPVIPQTAKRLSGISMIGAASTREIPAPGFAPAGMTSRQSGCATAPTNGRQSGCPAELNSRQSTAASHSRPWVLQRPRASCRGSKVPRRGCTQWPSERRRPRATRRHDRRRRGQRCGNR